jgi:hypothetical protein
LRCQGDHPGGIVDALVAEAAHILPFSGIVVIVLADKGLADAIGTEGRARVRSLMRSEEKCWR